MIRQLRNKAVVLFAATGLLQILSLHAASASAEKTTAATAFTVRRGSVVSHKGSKQICQADNAFITDVLSEQSIPLKDCDYHVLVKELPQGSQARISGAEFKPSVVYYVDKVQCKDKRSFAELMKKLSNERIINAVVSASEAPVTVHLFTAGEKLIILSHYGLPDVKAPTEITTLITEIRKAEL